jgi:hypothetical protein
MGFQSVSDTIFLADSMPYQLGVPHQHGVADTLTGMTARNARS